METENPFKENSSNNNEQPNKKEIQWDKEIPFPGE